MRINTFKLLTFILLALLGATQFSCTQQQEPIAADDNTPAELRLLNQKIADDPDNPQNFIDRSVWFINHNLFDSAMIDVRKALVIDSINPLFYITLSDVYQLKGNFKDAEKALLKARTISPDNNEAKVAHARFYLVFQNYDEAFKLVDEAIKKTPFNPKAYFIAGMAYLEKGDTLSAIKNLMQSTAQDNEYFDAWLRLALIYSNKQDQLAEGYFKTALRLRPDSKAAWYLAGFFYQEKGEFQKAISAYDSVLKIDPNFRDAIYNKGYVAMIADEDYDKAIELFGAALQVSPNWTDALYNRGYAQELKGEKEKARDDYKEVLKIAPDYDKAINGLNRIGQ